jgi:ribosomal protein S18 acetylase RimI-like enzyme
MRASEIAPKQGLTIFDIDDTLLHTTAQIRVVKNGQTVRELTNQQFNTYTLAPGEEFDFGEFRSAEKFNQESQPIPQMINLLKNILQHAANHKVIMLTARADFDNRDLFLKTFTDLGIDMSRVHVHRAGNLPGDDHPAEKKAIWVRRYLDSGYYNRVRLFDDSMSNLRVFNSLKTEYPDVKFYAYFVKGNGSIEQFNQGTVDEMAIVRIPRDKVATQGREFFGQFEMANQAAVRRMFKNLTPLPGGSGLMYGTISHSDDGNFNIAIVSGQHIVGMLILKPVNGFPLKDAYSVEFITVDENQRGMSIAKSLYGIALSILKFSIVAGESQTVGGRRNWISLSRVPGVKIMGWGWVEEMNTPDRSSLSPEAKANLKQIQQRFEKSMERAGGHQVGTAEGAAEWGRKITKHWYLFPVTAGTREFKTQANAVRIYYNDHYDLPIGQNNGLVAVFD